MAVSERPIWPGRSPGATTLRETLDDRLLSRSHVGVSGRNGDAARLMRSTDRVRWNSLASAPSGSRCGGAATWRSVIIRPRPRPTASAAAGRRRSRSRSARSGAAVTTTSSSTDSAGEAAHHFLCVKAPRPVRNRMVLVLTTNTLHAYNYWGGRSAYCDVEALMSRRARLPEAMANCLGVLSTQRPIAQMLLAAPPDMPRLVNLREARLRTEAVGRRRSRMVARPRPITLRRLRRFSQQMGARLRSLGRARGIRFRLSDGSRPRRRCGRARLI